MNGFYSHVYKDENNKITDRKLLREHIQNILSSVGKSYHHNDFTHRYFHILETAIKLHDLGKYTQFFQDYLESGKKHPRNHHYHSLTGAVTVQKFLSQINSSREALFGFLISLHHHSNLKNIIYCYCNLNETLLKVHKTDLINKAGSIKQDIDLDINYALVETAPDLFNDTEDLVDEENIENYFIINYLFSLLIEADKLDASNSISYSTKKINASSVDEYINSKPVNALSTLRTDIRKAIISKLDNNNYIDSKLFTLTAPTGAGKTLAVLDFALKLKEKIENDRAIQIIYGLPFINIIEQNFEEYKKTLPNNNVLAHYQFADIFEQTKGYSEEKGKTNYNQKAMLLDTWQSDVVVTSFVQLLQTLIGNRNKLLKKFHHFANSIIILDEVQTLKLGHLPLIGSALYYISELLDARIILMTATRPLVFELANKWILKNAFAKPKELLLNHSEYFRKFNRTKIIPLFGTKLKDTTSFIKIFIEKWKERKYSSCIIVCNTVNRSLEVFRALQNFLKETKCINPLFYLSTNVIPSQREKRIHKIDQALKDSRKPILVCTQVVEAGVNLDFDMGFRDIGPLDSIIQVAGRINRENDPKKQESPLYIIDFNDCDKVYDTITSKHTKRILAKYQNKNGISETRFLEMIDEYFQSVSNESEYTKSLSIFSAMKRLNYDEVSTFKIIEDKNWAISVFIEFDAHAVKAREAFEKMRDGSIEYEQFQRYKRDFHQRIIAIPEYLSRIQHIKKMNWLLSENLWYVPFEELQNYYNKTTGFIRTPQKNEVVCML